MHVAQQLLIMLDDTVVAAVIVREPISDIAVLSGFEGERFSNLVHVLRRWTRNCGLRQAIRKANLSGG